MGPAAGEQRAVVTTRKSQRGNMPTFFSIKAYPRLGTDISVFRDKEDLSSQVSSPTLMQSQVETEEGFNLDLFVDVRPFSFGKIIIRICQ